MSCLSHIHFSLSLRRLGAPVVVVVLVQLGIKPEVVARITPEVEQYVKEGILPGMT
jgi:hypothetical protein